VTELTTEEKRSFFVNDLVAAWEPTTGWSTKLWNSITKAMVFVGNYPGFSGSDKKAEVLKIVELLLERTDSPGPDFIVDKFILWAVSGAVDKLVDASKDKFAF